MDLRSEQLELSHGVGAPRAARSFVTRVLGQWGVDGLALERFQLLVSELVSNAVLHGDGTIQMAVTECEPEAAMVRVEVRNQGAGEPRMRNAAQDDLSGRGLRLIDELSERWGTDARAGTTVVWFEAAPGPA